MIIVLDTDENIPYSALFSCKNKEIAYQRIKKNIERKKIDKNQKLLIVKVIEVVNETPIQI